MARANETKQTLTMNNGREPRIKTSVTMQPPPLSYGPEPQIVTCPRCGINVTTHIETEPNMKTHLMAALLCALGLCCCVPCPYFMDSCLAKKHYCPECKTYLGYFSK